MLLKKYKYQMINFYKVIIIKINKKDKSINNNILNLISMEVIN